MDLRADLIKSAVMEFIEEAFAGMEFNVSNVSSLVVAKIFIDRKFDKYINMVADDQGMVPVDLIEKYGMEAMSKLNVVEIPKFDGKLLFKQEDFVRLMSKIKSKGNM